ncbi:hypothetical protein HK414_13380 [Ramlibacter terrae]|uniref:Uncharacterized protein n=1 Tax=Ramlibacter terrae TaxID=2732511 RepID=A0ABX6P4A9_9BURK|nr:hypothetical protein HK414_13380 [Ramlibacter terrae]
MLEDYKNQHESWGASATVRRLGSQAVKKNFIGCTPRTAMKTIALHEAGSGLRASKRLAVLDMTAPRSVAELVAGGAGLPDPRYMPKAN